MDAIQDWKIGKFIIKFVYVCAFNYSSKVLTTKYDMDIATCDIDQYIISSIPKLYILLDIVPNLKCKIPYANTYKLQ